MAKILVVGSLCLDYYLGETAPPLQFPGGKGGNQAVSAKRLGAAVKVMAKVGSDKQGEFLRQNLEREGISTHLVKQVAGVPTGYCQIQLATGDIRGFPGANLSWELADLAEIMPQLAKADCLLLQFEIPPTFVLQLLAAAEKLGKLVIFNPAPVRQTQLPELAEKTYLVVNRREAHYYSEIPQGDLAAAERAARSLRKKAAHIVVTLGAEGALVASKDSITYIPAQKVATVDAIGAGDALCAALAVSLLEGESLSRAAHFAVGFATQTTTAIGAQSASS